MTRAPCVCAPRPPVLFEEQPLADCATLFVRVARMSPRPLFHLPAVAALALFAWLPLCGCAESRVSLATGPREYVPSDYPQVLQTWTRNESLIALSELSDELNVTATYESWDFRWAYVIRYAADYRLTIEQRRELMEQTLHATADDHEFYVALYGTNWRWVDLSRPTSAWIVRLIDDKGSETAPEKIEAIVKPGPLELRYFPFTTVWRRVFRIRFPRRTSDGRPTIANNAQWFGLRFAGAEGNEELRWEVDGPTDPSAARSVASHPGEDLEQGGARHE
jgi:hypothetical protein